MTAAAVTNTEAGGMSTIAMAGACIALMTTEKSIMTRRRSSMRRHHHRALESFFHPSSFATKGIPMIDATITITVPAEKRKEILQTLQAILGPIRREQGCISCNCYVDVEDEMTILFNAAWQTRNDLDTHLRSTHFGVLTGAMKLLKKEPDIRFNTIASTAGAEVIHGARA